MSRLINTAWIPTKKPRKKVTARPCLGILTSDRGSTFGGNRYNFADISRMGKKMGVLVCVITPKSFQYNNDVTVKGFVLKDQWVRQELPMPHVIYNRIPTRPLEQSPPFQNLIRKIKQMKNVHLFNPSFFDKWSLYTQLTKSEELSTLLPESEKLDHLDTLKDLFIRHSTLFLKPINGKAGIGMMKITQLPRGYELIHQSSNGQKKYILPTLRMLWKQLTPLKQQQPYIVQQGISLSTFQDRPFDLRMLLQKGKDGKWGVTGLGIRVSGKTAISTHVPMGGRIEDVDTVLASVFGNQKAQVIQRVKKIGLQIAPYIEKSQAEILGEMSMDLGIEPSGKLWFFEANAKPMKFDEPEIRRKSLQNIIYYSLYLKNQSKQLFGVASQ